MIELFLGGGVVAMSFLTLLLILVVIASSKLKHLVRSFGMLAFVVGLLSAIWGIYSAFSVIEQFGNASPSIIAGGIKVALTTLVYGTFILIVSSVTMVLAVEAGHRMDKKGVVKWMIATVIGGLFFLLSQVWEWSHFIHGSEFGKIELNDGSQAIVHGEFGGINSFTVLTAGKHHKKDEIIKDDLMHTF